MLFFKETGDVSEEVWDIILYAIVLDNNTEVQKAFYKAHMESDVATKNSIHAQYFSATSAVLKNHIDTFLHQLDELSEKATSKDIKEHPRIPIIMKHNAFVKETFLKVKTNVDAMVVGKQVA